MANDVFVDVPSKQARKALQRLGEMPIAAPQMQGVGWTSNQTLPSITYSTSTAPATYTSAVAASSLA